MSRSERQLGGIARTGHLTWGQQLFWYYNQPTFRDEWGTMPLIFQRIVLPEGTSVQELQAALDHCAERYDALRTVYHQTGGQLPEQQVLATYAPPIYEVDDEDPPNFDLERVPGFRCRISREGDKVISAELIANQIDLDGHSMVILERCIGAFLAGDPEPFPIDVLQPVDCAVEESTRASLIANSRRGLAWHTEVRRRVVRNFIPFVGTESAVGTASLRLPGLLESVERTARRSRVTTPSVLQAAIGLVIHRWLGTDGCLVSTAVSNRWRPGLRHAVGRFASEIDWMFSCEPHQTIEQFLQGLHATLLAGYRFGARDIDACTMAAVRENCADGAVMAKPVFIEYLDFLRDRPRLHGTVKETEFRYETKPGDHTRLRFDLVPRWPGIEIRLETDTRVASRRESEQLLRLVAETTEALCGDPDLPLGTLLARVSVPRFDYNARGPWNRLGASRFSPQRTRTAVMRCDGVTNAAVRSEDDATPDVYITGAADLVRVHEHLLSAASTDPLIVVPRRYLAVAELPHQAGAPPSAVFTPGTDYDASNRADARTGAVLKAVEDHHPGLRAECSRTYAELGGRFLMIPSVVSEIERQGYTRPHPDWFLGLSSLAAIANQLQIKP